MNAEPTTQRPKFAKVLSKPTLSWEEARTVASGLTPDQILKGASESACPCQAAKHGWYVPHMPELAPYNQQGREYLANVLMRERKIGCFGKPAFRRDVCLASGEFPCLRSIQNLVMGS